MRSIRLQRLAVVARGRAARAGSWALVGQGAGVLSSMANFLVLARLIGPADYGRVAAAWALVLTLGPILTFGAERLLVRDVSGLGRQPAEALTAALLTVLVGSGMSVAVVLLLQPLVLPQVPLVLLAALAVADIAAIGAYGCLFALCFATGEPRASGLLAVSVAVAKVGAVVAFAAVDGEDPVVWSLFYAGFAVALVLLQLAWAVRRFGRPVVDGYRFFARAREGLPYSGAQAATVVQNDSDKVLLVRAGYATEAGLYSVAYRLAATAYMPVLAVLQSTFPRFFAAGARDGIEGTSALARRLALPLVAYGIVAVVGLLAVAPLVPLLVGEQYRGSVSLLLVLSVLPLLRVGQALGGDALTGAGLQSTRTRCLFASAGLNVVLNLVFIPTHGVAAAIAATLAAEVVGLSLVHLAVRRHRHRARPVETPRAATPA